MHTIRLRGPWEQEPLAGGRVCYARRFHQPTGLGEERVWLVLGDVCREVTLNGQRLSVQANRCDVTPLLLPSNLLSVTTDAPAPTVDLARLEIG